MIEKRGLQIKIKSDSFPPHVCCCREQEEQEQRSRNDDKLPKVSIHSSHGTFDSKDDGSSTAYIINGPETNVAAGSGLRGIRWLRGP